MAERPLQVLLLEDNAADAELIGHELARAGIPHVTERVETERAFVQALKSSAPDVILSDHSLAATRSPRSGRCERTGRGPR